VSVRESGYNGIMKREPWRAFAGIMAEKLLDLANLAVAALIFGQFLSPQGFRWPLTTLALAIWLILSLSSYGLVRLKEEREGEG